MTEDQMARAAERSVEDGRFPNMAIAWLWQVFIHGKMSDEPGLEWYQDPEQAALQPPEGATE